ncbi:DeoR/GlpR family DNA-binding transcription regulator [Candidatus Epulonipiscium viviparus]|uniref:DeoR/GlpR family DNA-binding transcription regulator n=1 Tax=Candidatus Epulonipiscium viviparus TaxID=420336 RepID=UPI0021019901|nr:DeoR/GlpR family DNA-binding transcription regulator [Candidatus Epulopiscium viviparus]
MREILYTKKQINVNELAAFYNVSPVSIRKDLAILECEGVLTRVYGGGILKEDPTKKLAFLSRGDYPILKKIALRACEEIEEGDTIFLGSGRTCCELAKLLYKFNSISVVTNNIGCLDNLLRAGAEIYLLGGKVTSTDGLTLFSSPKNNHQNSANFLENIRVDKAFTSASAVNLKQGLAVSSVISLPVYDYVSRMSQKWYLMIDSDKFDTVNLYAAAKFEDIDYIITDSIPDSYEEAIVNANVIVYKINEE